jgi:uncharacterized protein
MLLDAKAPVDIESKRGVTPLMLAAERGHREIVRLLLARGADSNKQDYTGRNALGWAQDGNQNATIQILKKAGAK